MFCVILEWENLRVKTLYSARAASIKLSPCHFDVKQAYAYCKRNFDPISLRFEKKVIQTERIENLSILEISYD